MVKWYLVMLSSMRWYAGNGRVSRLGMSGWGGVCMMWLLCLNEMPLIWLSGLLLWSCLMRLTSVCSPSPRMMMSISG